MSAPTVLDLIRTFIRVQAGKRLARLGGQAPRMADAPRRRVPAHASA